MRTELRIVAGSLRGRKVTCNVTAELRPTPQRVREALFSILGNAVPERWFVDVFAGTGILGLEALSRGAKGALFIERDVRLAQAIEDNLHALGLAKEAKLFRTDSYRWTAAWQPPAEPVNVFLSPPFADLEEHPDDLIQALRGLQGKVAEDSVIVLQSEKGAAIEDDAFLADWERRSYGRNVLLLWQKENPVLGEPPA